MGAPNLMGGFRYWVYVSSHLSECWGVRSQIAIYTYGKSVFPRHGYGVPKKTLIRRSSPSDARNGRRCLKWTISAIGIRQAAREATAESSQIACPL